MKHRKDQRVVVLTEDVPNEHWDRRTVYNWRTAEKWPKGMRFLCWDEDILGDGHGFVPMMRPAAGGESCNSRHPAYMAIIPYTEPAPDDFRTFCVMEGLATGGVNGGLWYELVKEMIDQGVVDMDGVRKAVKAIDERDG